MAGWIIPNLPFLFKETRGSSVSYLGVLEFVESIDKTKEKGSVLDFLSYA